MWVVVALLLWLGLILAIKVLKVLEKNMESSRVEIFQWFLQQCFQVVNLISISRFHFSRILRGTKSMEAFGGLVLLDINYILIALITSVQECNLFLID